MIEIPLELEWWRARPEGAAWLERLPRIVEERATEWGLLVRPFEGGSVAFVAPVECADGSRAVLKVNFPDRESEREALPRNYELTGRSFERSLLDEALAAIAELSASQGEQVVLHQDFHGGNVLRDQREPWLAIDPKPLAGEREFDTASLLRDRRPLLSRPGGARIVRRRLDQLSSELQLDRERMRRWGIVHALAWGISKDRAHEAHIEVARMLTRA